MSLHPHDETVPIRVEDVTFNKNPQLFFSGMQFNITLFCNRVLTGAIQCRITYQNVASQRLNTQIIGTTFIEPPALGRKVIVLQASTPKLKFIPEEHLMDETRIYVDLICNDVSFVSIPISVSHSYDDERINQFRRDCVFVYHVLRHFKCFCCEEVMYRALAI
ncbi:hypothetical protein AAC387_Pa05g3711 [Persea americana]